MMDRSTAKLIINQVYAAGGVEYSAWSRAEYEQAMKVKLGEDRDEEPEEIELIDLIPAVYFDEDGELIFKRNDLDDVVREVRIKNAEMTVHIPTEYDDIHDEIEKTIGARYVKDYEIIETYEIERW